MIYKYCKKAIISEDKKGPKHKGSKKAIKVKSIKTAVISEDGTKTKRITASTKSEDNDD